MQSALIFNRFTLAAARLDHRVKVESHDQRIVQAERRVRARLETIYSTASQEEAARLAKPWLEILYRLNN